MRPNSRGSCHDARPVFVVVTQSDVARAAGVSLMTVSNVVTGRANVRPATRSRVLQAIQELDYRVNVVARNLRTGRTGTIALAVPEVDRPYFGQLAALIISHAADLGYRVAIEQTSAQRETELSTLTDFRQQMYDGLILSAVGLGETDAAQLKVDFPVVILGERIFHGPVDHVAMANADGGAAAAELLLEAGCRAPAFLGWTRKTDVDMSTLRRDGFHRAVLAAGLDVHPRHRIAMTDLSLAGGYEGISRLLGAGVAFDGVFCITDTVAIGALRRLHEAGMRVPQDVAVVGFDDIAEARYSVPSLSTIAFNHGAMAREAVELLIAQIDGTGSPTPTETVADFVVARRESTAR